MARSIEKLPWHKKIGLILILFSIILLIPIGYLIEAGQGFADGIRSFWKNK